MKFEKLVATINVVSCTRAQNYDVEKKTKSDKSTPDGKPIWELLMPEETTIKRGEIELKGLEYSKLNSLVELPVGRHDVELEMFEMKSGTFFRAKCLANAKEGKRS